ncbi:DUF4190 domain-containing protein [Microbacterium sp.]|uniref:DUF4190 domain-containing protein n=1 Tax=Microbacterium sp. TaxID=51671 RepID=UPI0039E3163C
MSDNSTPPYDSGSYPSPAQPPQPLQSAPQPQAYPAVTPLPPTYRAAAPLPQAYPIAAPQGYGQGSPAHPGYAPIGYAIPRPSSGLAIASLVCGLSGLVLFWLFLPVLASFVAVITGHMALRQTKENPVLAGRGMAITGLITGYIGVGILVAGVAFFVLSLLLLGAFTIPFLTAPV